MDVVRYLRLTLSLSLALAVAGCGGSHSSSFSPLPGSTFASTSVPQVQHVAVIVLENQSFSAVVNSGAMPFFNSLIQQGGLATNYFSSAHPSLPNYFALTTGQTLVSANVSAPQSAESVVRALSSSGKSWKGYFQSLPSTGYLGADVPPYVQHHNPFAYLTDVLNSGSQQQNVVNLTQLGVDAGANNLPNYLFIVADDNHNAGDGCPNGAGTCTNDDKLAAADAWLRDTVGTLQSSSSFRNSGVFVVVFDEAAQSDIANGGGHVAMVVSGTRVKAGYQSPTFFQHPSVLRFALQALGAGSFPGQSGSANPMGEFFQ